MYIVEKLTDYSVMPSGFILSKCEIDGSEVDAIAYENEDLKDFYVLNCYVSGKTGYYRFDVVEGTVQRAADFDAALNPDEEPVAETAGALAWFTNMNNTGKTIFIIILVTAVVLIALAVILIIKIASAGKNENFEQDAEVSDTDEFVLNDFADDTHYSETETQNETEPDTDTDEVQKD